MAMAWARIVFVLLLASGLSRAQDLDFKEESGSGWLSLQAREAPLQEVLLAFARRKAISLEILPAIFQKVAELRINFHFEKMPPAEVLHCIEGACDLVIRIEDDALKVRPLPSEKDETRGEWLRLQTLWTVKRLLLVPGDPVAGEALLMAGALHRAAGEHRSAVLMLRRFIALQPDDIRGAKARLWAASSSAFIGANEQARSLVRDLEQRFPNAPEVMRGQLLLAGVDRKEGNKARTLTRLSRILNLKKKDRTHALAILFQAESWYLFGNAEAAVNAVEKFDGELMRLHPDLGEQLAYARGMCLLGRGEVPAALLSLRLALMSDPRPDRRLRAAIALAEAYRQLGDPITALVALRTARRLDGSSDLQIRTAIEEARLLDRNGVSEEAINRLMGIVARGDEFETSKRRDEILEFLGRMLISAERFEQARAIFSRFRSIAGRHAWATFMMARCDFGSGEFQRALTLLDDLSAEERSTLDAGELARFRGECLLALGEYEKASKAFADLGAR